MWMVAGRIFVVVDVFRCKLKFYRRTWWRYCLWQIHIFVMICLSSSCISCLSLRLLPLFSSIWPFKCQHFESEETKFFFCQKISSQYGEHRIDWYHTSKIVREKEITGHVSNNKKKYSSLSVKKHSASVHTHTNWDKKIWWRVHFVKMKTKLRFHLGMKSVSAGASVAIRMLYISYARTKWQKNDERFSSGLDSSFFSLFFTHSICI